MNTDVEIKIIMRHNGIRSANLSITHNGGGMKSKRGISVSVGMEHNGHVHGLIFNV